MLFIIFHVHKLLYSIRLYFQLHKLLFNDCYNNFDWMFIFTSHKTKLAIYSRIGMKVYKSMCWIQEYLYKKKHFFCCTFWTLLCRCYSVVCVTLYVFLLLDEKRCVCNTLIRSQSKWYFLSFMHIMNYFTIHTVHTIGFNVNFLLWFIIIVIITKIKCRSTFIPIHTHT